MYLGKDRKSDLAGHKHLIDILGMMKESNVWRGNIIGYFFKGMISSRMKSAIQEYARAARWQSKTTPRTVKQGILWRAQGKKYLLIVASYRGMGSKIYCSLTII